MTLLFWSHQQFDFDPKWQLVAEVDTSGVGDRVVLSQKYPYDNKLHQWLLGSGVRPPKYIQSAKCLNSRYACWAIVLWAFLQIPFCLSGHVIGAVTITAGSHPWFWWQAMASVGLLGCATCGFKTSLLTNLLLVCYTPFSGHLLPWITYLLVSLQWQYCNPHCGGSLF